MLSKKISYFLLIILFLSFIPYFTQGSDAAEFSQSLLRLNRLKSNTSSGGMVCAQPTTNLTEASVKITFPTGFTVNSNTSNWTVSTSNILSGSTAWPGIGTANNVSGQTVTFPSTNLSLGTYYCFNFSSSNTLTTGSTGDKTGTIATKTSGETTIDSTVYGVTIQNNDQLTVTATVPANPTDFEAQMELTNPVGDNLPQDTVLSYTLTYGSQLASPANIIVEAEWSLGTISGSGSPTVEILDYVVGSASDGYNSTPPVVDLINRKITWTINSFPGSTSGETVTFQLRTNDNYTGSETVSFDVSGRVIGPGTQTPDSTVTKNYLYSQIITPTPTTRPTSTPTPGSTTPTSPTTTPTPSIQPDSNLIIENVEIRGISPTTADIFVGLNKNAGITLNYGTSINSLSGTISSSENSSEFLIFLKDLNPNTQYFYRITARNATQTITSEIFTFTTSLRESEVSIIKKAFIVISNNLLIYAQSLADEKKISPIVIIPKNAVFTFSIAFENSSQIKSIQAFLRKKFVLSGNSQLGSNYKNVSLIETAPGEYTGKLDSGFEPDEYELYLRTSDFAGNIFEQKAGDFKIVNPLTVLEKGSGKPIEGASIKLSIYNPSTKIYDELNESNLPVKNPERTLVDGTTEIILPQGKYRAEITAFQYERKTVEFILGENTEEAYPTVYLEKAPFNLLVLSQYLFETVSDFYNLGAEFINNLSKSSRLFELISLVAFSIFTIFAFISLLFRTRNTPLSIYHYIMHSVKYRNLKTDISLKGIIKDDTNKPLAKAVISFLKDNEIVFLTSTNVNGLFFTAGKDFDSIEVSKVGYTNSIFPFNNQLDEKTPVFHLKKRDNQMISFINNAVNTVKFILGLLFEILIIGLFLLEILFIPTLGLLEVLPFLVITLIMLVIFIHQNALGKGRYF